MCGIAGILSKPGGGIGVQALEAMSKAIEHRGPDDLGFLGWRAGGGAPVLSRNVDEALKGGANVAFAHRRLSIIDESDGGWQPMGDATGRFFITYNGEIYNYIELRAELETEGVVFKSTSDSEVLLNALARWGIAKTLPKLTGMFAFALLDTQAGTVTLARDPFGIKPLSYTSTSNGLAFASEIPALLQAGNVNRAINPQALYDYLRFGLTDRGSDTLFAAIHHLPAAHYAVLSLEHPTVVESVRYWAPSVGQTLDISFEEATSKLRQLFMDSISQHLRSDVAVGAALSGGIDSSAVVCAMRELDGSDLQLHTFSFIAADRALSEERWADMAAGAAGATQHKVCPTGSELATDLDALIATQGEPFGSTSIYAQNRVFRLARENGIKVTLDGQGADEILAGYVPFIAARMASMLGRGQLLGAARLLGASAGGQPGAMTRTTLRAMRFLLPMGLQGVARRAIGEGLMAPWMNERWFSAHGVNVEAPQRPISGDVLRHELMASLTDRVLPQLLRVQDRNAMAHSVESRVPFLTTELVDFLYTLPEEFLIAQNGETKAVFRHAMRGLVPDAILDRRDKIGFVTPESQWLNEAGPWLDDILKSETLRSIPAFKADAMAREVESVRAGKTAMGGPVWRWINLVRWAEMYEVSF